MAWKSAFLTSLGIHFLPAKHVGVSLAMKILFVLSKVPYSALILGINTFFEDVD